MGGRRNRIVVVALGGLGIGAVLAVAAITSVEPLVAWFAGWSIATFAAYGIDKAQARRGGWRVPELGLHGLALLGGAAGGWLGMLTFRHKTRHRAFATVLAAATVLQVALLWVAIG